MNSRLIILALLVIDINLQFLSNTDQQILPKTLPRPTPAPGPLSSSSSKGSPSPSNGENNCCSSKLHIVYVVEDTKQTSPQARKMFKKFVRVSRWMAQKVSLFEIRGIPISKYDPMKAQAVPPSQIMDKFNTQPPTNQDYKITLGSLYYHPELYLGLMLQTGNLYDTQVIFLSSADSLNEKYNLSNGPYENFQDYLKKFYWGRVNEYTTKSRCPVQFYCYYYNPTEPKYLNEYRRMCKGFRSSSFQNLDQ